MLSEEKKIKTKAQLKEYLDAELDRYPISGRRYIMYFLQISEGAILRRHQILLRKTEYYLNSGRRIRGELCYARLMKLQNKYSVHIPINCCGKGLSIPHLLPLAINGDATVGENCRIHAGSYIAEGGGSRTGVPTIGNNELIGMNVILLGNVNIADNITIGAGSIVNKSFLEPGITNAGAPARKIKDGNSKF